jgi:hypothetical protein
MTAISLPQPVPQDSDVVDPVSFVDRLLSRTRLERDDDLARGEFGLRDPLTGKRYRVPVQDLTRYAARHLDFMHTARTTPF